MFFNNNNSNTPNYSFSSTTTWLFYDKPQQQLYSARLGIWIVYPDWENTENNHLLLRDSTQTRNFAFRRVGEQVF